MAEIPFLPPGPSEEFLRRQAMYAPQPGTATAGSFDPATGERQSQTFNVPVTQPPSQAMQMLESWRQQINLTKFKEQQKAYEAGVRFQHMREAQRMREAGATEEEIGKTLGIGLFYNNPNAYVSRMGQLTPAPDPYLTNFGGADAVIEGKNKTVRFIPKSALPAPPLPEKVKEIPIEKEDGTISEDEYAVPSASGRGLVVQRRAQKKDSVTPSARLAALKDQIEEDQKELASHILKTTKEKATQEFQQRELELKQRIARKQAERAAVLEGIVTVSPQSPSGQPASSPLPMPKSKSELRKGQMYATPRGVATWDGDKFIIQ